MNLRPISIGMTALGQIGHLERLTPLTTANAIASTGPPLFRDQRRAATSHDATKAAIRSITLASANSGA